MGLFSFFRKNQQQSSAGNSDFYSRADKEKPAGRKRRPGTKREEAVDPMLPEKKRARRRLIGAIALVLAAVIGLPMILDSEPKPLADDIAIQIPSRDMPASIAHTPTASPQIANEAAVNTLSENEEVVETATPAKSDTPVKDAKADAKAAAPMKSAAVAEKIDTPEPKITAPPPTKKADDAARARAILEGKSTGPATAKTSGKIVLQVAALGSQDKVNELQKKLQGAGLKSYTQKVATASGEWIRVRIGPFANEAEAEKARAKLVKIGLNGKLVPA
jgi:DedD protein